MKLKTIIFKDFRQFYGEQIINLETTDKKNLVVIHAENNVGKTTFLKGFTWCLFKKESFKRKAYLNDYIFSQLTGKETATASVTLIFDDKKREYFVKRSIVVSNHNGIQYPKDEKLEVRIDGDPQSNQQDTINRILNPELSDYFFFEGESIGEMSAPENKEEIKNGIQYIMGLEVYDRAIKHTYQAKEHFRVSLRDLGSNEPSNTNSPIAQKADLHMQIKKEQKSIENLDKHIKHKEQEHKDIKDKLVVSKDIDSIEQKIQNLEAALERLDKDDIDVLTSIKKLISDNAYLAISQNTINLTNAFLSEKRAKGELPSNIREQFVLDLLENGTCICGTKIDGHNHTREHLQALLDKTVKKDIEDRFIDVNGFTSSHLLYQEIFTEHLEELGNQRKKLSLQKDELNTQLAENVTKRQSKSNSTTKELLSKLEAAEKTIEDKKEKHIEHNVTLKILESKMQDIEKELKDYHSQNSKIDTEEKRLTLAQSTLTLLEDEYLQLTNKVRERLTKKVSDIFDSIIHGNYKIKINKRFELELTKVVNDIEGETELSRGQEQIASLSFIAALVYIAKKWDKEHKQDTWGGAGVYPMVMDSPFGTLGQFYQSSLTKQLRSLAPQIIVMVSSSQWTKEVSQNFSKYCQHEYVFQHHHPEDQQVDQRYEDIIINKSAYPLEKIHAFEYTKIIEVK